MIANAATSRDETSDPARAAQKRLDQRSIVEQRRVRLCYAVAASAPIIAATASFAILRMAWLIGGPRMMTTAGGKSFWRVYEWGIFPGNLLIGSLVALLAILFFIPSRVGGGASVLLSSLHRRSYSF